jgi:N-acetylglutamate synthase-like GNAT family acetyltransferase
MRGMNVVIRAFDEKDWVQVRELHSTSFAHLAAACYTAEQMQAVERMIREPGYREELRESNLKLAVVGADIIGSVGWCQPDPDTARIRKVFVAPPQAGKGLGRRLMELVEGDIHSSGVREIVIRATMNAVPFYERLGFQQVRLDAMTASDGVRVPVTMMRQTSRSMMLSPCSYR